MLQTSQTQLTGTQAVSRRFKQKIQSCRSLTETALHGPGRVGKSAALHRRPRSNAESKMEASLPVAFKDSWHLKARKWAQGRLGQADNMLCCHLLMIR